MTNQTLQEKPRANNAVVQDLQPHLAPNPPKPSKLKEALHVTSMTVPIVGLLGTLFVWCAANFYVGDVEIVTEKPSPDLLVNVYSQRGQTFTFHVNKFQLMPGDYRVEVCPDGKFKLPADIKVQFHGINRIFVPFGSRTLSIVNVAPANASQGQAQATPEQSATTQPIVDAPSLTDSQTRPSEQEDLPPVIQDSPTAAQSPAPASQAASTAPPSASAPTAATEAPAIDSKTESAESTDSEAAPTDSKAHRKWWQVFRKEAQ